MKNKISRILAFSLILCMVFALAACGSSAPAQNTSGGSAPAASSEASSITESATTTAGKSENKEADAAAAAAAAEGGNIIVPGSTVSYGCTSDYPNLLPWMLNSGNVVYSQVFDNLLYKYREDLNDMRGNLAESWTVSEDGKTYVFQIKQGVKFTSGNPVNAEAFVKSWDAAKPYQGRFFASIESYEATGEYELTVKLVAPSSSIVYDTFSQPFCGVVDPAALEEYGPEDNKAAIGCGPYYYEEYVPGEKIVFKANPDYHHTPDRMPQIETLVFNIIPDVNTQLLAFLNGQLDVFTTDNIEAYKTLRDNGYEPLLIKDRVFVYWMNPKLCPIFKSDKVREAMCHMIDWNAVNDLAFDGVYVVPNSYFGDTGSYPYNEKYTYDPELACKLIEEAGYSKDDIAFTIYAGADATLPLIIQEQFRAQGFNNIQVQQLDGGAMMAKMKSADWEVWYTHNGYSSESPLTPYSMGLMPDAAQRCIFLEYIDPALQEKAVELYNKANTALTREEYLAAVTELTAFVQDQCVAFGGLQTVRSATAKDYYEPDSVIYQPVLGIPQFFYWRLK